MSSLMDEMKKEKRCKCLPVESKSCYNCICYYCTGVVCPWRNSGSINVMEDLKPGRCFKCHTGETLRVIYDCDYFTAYRYKRLILPKKINPKQTRYKVLLDKLEKIEELLEELTKNNS